MLNKSHSFLCLSPLGKKNNNNDNNNNSQAVIISPKSNAEIPASPPDEDPESCDSRLWLEGVGGGEGGRRAASQRPPCPLKSNIHVNEGISALQADSLVLSLSSLRRSGKARVPAGPMPLRFPGADWGGGEEAI